MSNHISHRYTFTVTLYNRCTWGSKKPVGAEFIYENSNPLSKRTEGNQIEPHILFSDIKIYPKEEYIDCYPEAKKIMSNIDPDDAPFLAL
jgi:hypothetical protein